MRALPCLALAMCCLMAPQANALPASDIAGVAVHPWRMQDPQEVERTFADIAATGAHWVRTDLRWLLVEPDGPSLSSGRADWSEMDAMVAAADRHGLQLLPIVAYVPAWANGEHDWWAYPDSARFEEFFAAALRRYPQVAAWELWNEPNFHVFAKPRPNPAAFVGFLRSADRIRDRVRPEAKLISGGLAPGADIDIVPWVDQVARLGGLEVIDGLGVHPYSPWRPDDPRAWMMQLEALHERLAFLGRPQLDLWLTEYGAPTSAAPSGWGKPLTEEQQAQRLRLAFALAARLPFVKNLTWFEYRDTCADPTIADCHFGLVRDDFSPRPAYHALAEVTAGTSAALRPRLALSSRVRKTRALRPGHRHGASRLVHVRGSLLLPGAAGSRSRVTLRILRRGAPAKTVRRVVRDGTFEARLRRVGSRRWTIVARYAGSLVYEPVVARLRVGSGEGRAASTAPQPSRRASTSARSAFVMAKPPAAPIPMANAPSSP